MLLDVTQLFDQYLTKNFGHKPEVLQFLLHHERRQICLQNLCGQIQIAEKRSKLRLNFDAIKYKLMIDEVAKMFAHAAVRVRVAELVSTAEKYRRQSEASKYDEIKSVVKGLDDEPRTKGGEN